MCRSCKSEERRSCKPYRRGTWCKTCWLVLGRCDSFVAGLTIRKRGECATRFPVSLVRYFNRQRRQTPLTQSSGVRTDGQKLRSSMKDSTGFMLEATHETRVRAANAFEHTPYRNKAKNAGSRSVKLVSSAMLIGLCNSVVVRCIVFEEAIQRWIHTDVLALKSTIEHEGQGVRHEVRRCRS